LSVRQTPKILTALFHRDGCGNRCVVKTHPLIESFEILEGPYLREINSGGPGQAETKDSLKPALKLDLIFATDTNLGQDMLMKRETKLLQL
jgi:hypothetical protein